MGNNRYNIDSPDEFNTQVVVLIYITKYSEYESVPQKNHESNRHKECSLKFNSLWPYATRLVLVIVSLKLNLRVQ